MEKELVLYDNHLIHKIKFHIYHHEYDGSYNYSLSLDVWEKNDDGKEILINGWQKLDVVPKKWMAMLDWLEMNLRNKVFDSELVLKGRGIVEKKEFWNVVESDTQFTMREVDYNGSKAIKLSQQTTFYGSSITLPVKHFFQLIAFLRRVLPGLPE